MKTVEELKKGDVVTIDKQRGNYEEAYVVLLGKKYIGVSYDMTRDYKVTKFEVDTLNYTDGKNAWYYPHLFLGTLEEFREKLNNDKECESLVRIIRDKVSIHLGKEKLKRIKDIIDE